MMPNPNNWIVFDVAAVIQLPKLILIVACFYRIVIDAIRIVEFIKINNIY